ALQNPFCAGARAITMENVMRLRALGGVIGLSVGPPFYDNSATLKRNIEEIAETPFAGATGYGGLAIGTDFLGVSRTLPELSNAEQVVAWFSAQFDPDAANALIWRNAHQLFRKMLSEGQAVAGTGNSPGAA